MGDTILQKTLPPMPSALNAPKLKNVPNPGESGGPESYNEGIEKVQAINNRNIDTLKGALRTDVQMKDFQRLMSVGTKAAYSERQKNEMGSLAFDPSKVSGATFNNVLTKLETERGTDKKKIYEGITSKYSGVQAEVKKRMDYLQDLENKKREYMIQYKYDTKAAKKLKSGKSTAKKRLKAEKEQFNREYIQGLQSAGNDTSYLDFTVEEIQQGIEAMAQRGHDQDSITKALNIEGIPTFPGSVANDQLIMLFGGK
jgi:hypothetical protein